MAPIDRRRLVGAGVILLDISVLLWLDQDKPTLGPSSLELIMEAWTSGSLANGPSAGGWTG